MLNITYVIGFVPNQFQKQMEQAASDLVEGNRSKKSGGIPEQPADRGVANIRDIEGSLYHWVGTKPRPRVEKSQAEINLEKEEIPGNKTYKNVIAATGVIAKTSAQAAMGAHRGTKTIRDKVDLHSRCLVQVKDELAHIRRVLTRYDRPLQAFEMATNPQLNPHLNTYIPFDSQYRVGEFFESRERVVELMRYIIHNVPWNVNNFCLNTVRLICTFDYRDKHQFPGKIRYERYTYVPDVLEEFLYSAASLAASRSTVGGYNKEICQGQLRSAFHNNQVLRDRKRKSEGDISPSKRKYPYRGFDDSDETREENREGDSLYQDLIPYTSFMDESQDIHSSMRGTELPDPDAE